MPKQLTVEIAEKTTARVSCALSLTPNAAAEASTSTKQASPGDQSAGSYSWAYATGIGGALLLATAGGLALWNEARYGDWQRKDEELERLHDTGAPFPPDAQREQNENDALLDSVKTVDIATLVTAAVGVAGITTGVVFWATGARRGEDRISASFTRDSTLFRVRSLF